jgi:hypothetical protein
VRKSSIQFRPDEAVARAPGREGTCSNDSTSRRRTPARAEPALVGALVRTGTWPQMRRISSKNFVFLRILHVSDRNQH